MALDLLTSAVVISLVGFMEAISIAKAMAAKTKDRIDPNQELIGQGLANILGSLSQSYPVSGSFSRSAVNLNAGRAHRHVLGLRRDRGADYAAVPHPAAVFPAPVRAGRGDHDGGGRAHQLQGHPPRLGGPSARRGRRDRDLRRHPGLRPPSGQRHPGGCGARGGSVSVPDHEAPGGATRSLSGRDPAGPRRCTPPCRRTSGSSSCASTASSISPTCPISRTPSWRPWRTTRARNMSWWWRTGSTSSTPPARRSWST